MPRHPVVIHFDKMDGGVNIVSIGFGPYVKPLCKALLETQSCKTSLQNTPFLSTRQSPALTEDRGARSNHLGQGEYLFAAGFLGVLAASAFLLRKPSPDHVRAEGARTLRYYSVAGCSIAAPLRSWL